MIWLLAKLGLVKGIVLLDFEGEEYTTIKRKSAFHPHRWARVHWFTCVGRVILREDGTIDPKSPSCFVKRWVDIKPFWKS